MTPCGALFNCQNYCHSKGLRHSLSTQPISFPFCRFPFPARVPVPLHRGDVGNWQKHVYPVSSSAKTIINHQCGGRRRPSPRANKTQSNIIINEGRTQTTNPIYRECWPHAAHTWQDIARTRTGTGTQPPYTNRSKAQSLIPIAARCP